jgi:hypothetical protein
MGKMIGGRVELRFEKRQSSLLLFVALLVKFVIIY